MAILPMKRIHIYALLKDRKRIMEMLQRFGTVQIEDNLEEDEIFLKKDISGEKQKVERDLTLVSQALDILESHVPEPKSILDTLNGRRELSVEDFERLGSKQDDIRKMAEHIKDLDRTIAECKSEIHKINTQIEALSPWSSLDIPLQFQGTRSTCALTGTLPGELSLENILDKLADMLPDADEIHADIISSGKDQTHIFLLCPRHNASAVEGALRSMGFARPPVSSGNIIPAEQKTKLEAERAELERLSEKSKNEIIQHAEKRDELKFLYDWLTMRLERLENKKCLLESKYTFIIAGYIPQKEIQAVTSALSSRFLVYIELNDPGEDEDVPVLLENSKFSEPVEGVLRSFSYPGKGEIDPISIMSVFYYILFGLMLSDAAYGLLMTIGCGICLLKFKNMESGMRKTLRMFFFCGISTTFWGAMFGSWFGDVVTVVSSTFFNKTAAIKPIWFEPMRDPMRMLVFSMAMGIVHLFTGLGAKLYQCIRAKQYKDALYDAVFWYMLVGGLIIFALSTEKFVEILNLSFILPKSAGNAAAVIAAIAAIGIVLTSGRESRNWFKRILKGLYGLYNITGYMSDILSYSRLLALGLATGVIASVINQMGAMGGRSVAGAILFIVVFLAGHSINIGINLLGAYVHTNRLSFVEFFGKFYEGGGSEFTPLGVHTKYYKLREESNHG
ncbi:MAG TPA: V-type ATP synthase subunit I [Clostridiales bacterium]|nr:V-type ATP synthase subunit I [Clostridiales bacterium]